MQHPPPSSAPGLEPETEEADTLDSRFPRSGLQIFFSRFPFWFFFFLVQEAFLEIPPSALHWFGRYQPLLRIRFLSFPWTWVPVLRMVHDDHSITNDEGPRPRDERYGSRTTLLRGSMPRHTPTLLVFFSLRTGFRIFGFGDKDLQPGLDPIMATLLSQKVDLRSHHLVAETWPYPEYGRRGRHRLADRILADIEMKEEMGSNQQN
ncbi:hypothetical protein CGRA01v4_06843 [Colletotrichum graminicola]|nr:hypothetical protein CGRA01v4_06843 [Colletotrichum graminicola]